MTIVPFSTIVSHYKVIFFDAFGVLKNYKGLVPGIETTFDALEKNNQTYFIVTNDASRSPEQLAASYHSLGFHRIQPDRIISSGMLAKEFIELKVKEGIVAYLGTEGSAHYIQQAGIQTLPVSAITDHNIADVNALVLLDDEGFDWYQDINKAVNLLRKRTIPAIVANTDNTYPLSKHEVAIAIGGIATMLESIVGKRFIRFGKPDTQVFMFAFELARHRQPDLRKQDILMVGDTLLTDIAGGNNFGLDTALVLTGNTRMDDYETRIKSTGIMPTYICDSAVVNDK
ncbi:MAG: TIGR01459 family HAD-type hydrolase [Cytophagaceae bacterium]|jgi:HAD superfamily hydrolase (TIGR01450 family)|nr:TIGR01459 family HAD-type hydrolase [Cytophagaceae bacterium]